MSGIMGVLLWWIGAAMEPAPVSLRWSFIVAGLLALVVASFRTWQRERRLRTAFDTETHAKALKELQELGDAEKQVLRQLLVLGQMLEEQIGAYLHQQGLPAVNLSRLEQVGLVARNGGRGYWSINPAFVTVLKFLLART